RCYTARRCGRDVHDRRRQSIMEESDRHRFGSYSNAAFYVPFGGPVALNAWFVERLIASPDKSLSLLPAGKATAEKLTTIDVGGGPKGKTVTAWAVSGLNNSPIPFWTEGDGKFFGYSTGISWLPDDYESERARLEKAQGDALAARMPAIARSL